MGRTLNRVQLTGNLGRDPEVRHAAAGNPIVNLSMATSEWWRDKDSRERRESTEWHRVVIFNRLLAEMAIDLLHTGDTIYVEGQLKSRKYTDQAGVEKQVTEVVIGNYAEVHQLQLIARPDPAESAEDAA